MLTVMAPTVVLLLLKSSSKRSMPGDKMDDAKGVRKVMADTRPTTSHFLLWVKFRGMSGSSWDSQPTMPSSRLEVGMGAKAMRSRVFFRPTMLSTPEILLFTLLRVPMRRRSWLSWLLYVGVSQKPIHSTDALPHHDDPVQLRENPRRESSLTRG